MQHALGATNAVAFDITAACSGFVVALNTAAQYVRSGTYKNALIVGGDALSRVIDWQDRCEYEIDSLTGYLIKRYHIK